MHIIKEIAKNANIGIDAIDSIKTSVKDEELKQVILSQRARLCDIKDKAVAELEGDDRDVDANFFEKTMLRGAIKMNT
ncbi:MAG TPA: hypothetical protein P5161_05830, partial [Eubacteriales bacterium]|nr:hypothetical protein [Eubacteriales bacterium]